MLQAKSEQLRQRRERAIDVGPLAYQKQTLRPIVCLAFVLPLVFLYEVGSILMGGQAIRTGVELWLGQLLDPLGFGEVVVLPLIVTAALVVWHHRNDDHWRIGRQTLPLMILESIVLGAILFLAANVCYALATVTVLTPDPAPPMLPPSRWLATHISMLGSGIYEELFFRLLLLLPLMAWATWLLQDRRAGTIAAMLVVSVVFALVHYQLLNPAGGSFELSSFIFRFCASIVFSILFLFRGFGIAVGAHVFHDVLTQV